MSVEPGEMSGGRHGARLDGGSGLENNGSQTRQREAAVSEAGQALVRGFSGKAGRRPDGSGRGERGRESWLGLRVQAEGARYREDSCDHQGELPETGPSH